MAAREAEGAILAHGVRTPAGAFKKGRALAAADIDALLAAGQETVVAARLEAGDVGEDAAAATVAAAARGDGVAAAAPFAGRSNLYAEGAGLALVDPARGRRPQQRRRIADRRDRGALRARRAAAHDGHSQSHPLRRARGHSRRRGAPRRRRRAAGLARALRAEDHWPRHVAPPRRPRLGARQHSAHGA